MSYKSYINQALQDIYGTRQRKQQQQGYGQGYQGGGGYGGLMQRPAETFGGAQPTGGYSGYGGYGGAQTSVVSEALQQDTLGWREQFMQDYPGSPSPLHEPGTEITFTTGRPGGTRTEIAPSIEEWLAMQDRLAESLVGHAPYGIDLQQSYLRHHFPYSPLIDQNWVRPEGMEI